MAFLVALQGLNNILPKPGLIPIQHTDINLSPNVELEIVLVIREMNVKLPSVSIFSDVGDLVLDPGFCIISVVGKIFCLHCEVGYSRK